MLLAMLLGSPVAQAQLHTVTGTVTAAEDDLPLIGVSIVEMGTMNGTASDVDGSFALAVSNPDAVLVFSYIGYVSQNIPVNQQAEINVEMVEDTHLLEEVVVTAGGIERKERALGY